MCGCHGWPHIAAFAPTALRHSLPLDAARRDHQRCAGRSLHALFVCQGDWGPGHRVLPRRL